MKPHDYIMYHPDYPKSGAPSPHPYEDVTSSSAHQPKYAVAGAGGVITSATTRDVLNGRGQGVQRHPGNVKYRTLVFVNKGLYAQCPRNDKIKISKGIVTAVRKVGGRFLELDERSGIYQDIGDKKATEKTSQALREGQTKIRKKIYENETTKLAPDFSPPSPLTNIQREMSSEAYLGYSVQVLEALYIADENASDSTMTSDNKMVVATAAAAAVTDNMGNGYVQPPPTPPSAHGNSVMMAKVLEQLPVTAPSTQRVAPTQQEQDQNQNQNQNQNQTQNQQHQQIQMNPLPMPPLVCSSAYANTVAMARALEQFPEAASPAQKQQNHQQLMPPPKKGFANGDADSIETGTTHDQSPGSYSDFHAPVGRFTGTSLMSINEVGVGGGGGVCHPSIEGGRLTNMTLASMFSVNSLRQLLESARESAGSDRDWQVARGTIESVLSTEIRDLMQTAAPQLDLVGSSAMDEMDVLMDKEVDRFHKDTMEERVSDLRFTDASRWSSDSTESTNNSKSSSMDASMSSSDTMSVNTSPSCNKRSKYSTQHRSLSRREDSGDIASAELLLQLSVEHSGKRHAT